MIAPLAIPIPAPIPKPWYTSRDSLRFVAMFVLTGGYFIVELVYGIVFGSLALLADAMHMLSDFIALAVGFYAQIVGISSPSREHHNHIGHLYHHHHLHHHRHLHSHPQHCPDPISLSSPIGCASSCNPRGNLWLESNGSCRRLIERNLPVVDVFFDSCGSDTEIHFTTRSPSASNWS